MKGTYTSSSSSHSSTTLLAFIIKIVAFFFLLYFSLFYLHKHFSLYNPTTTTLNQHLFSSNSTHRNTVLAPAPAPSPPRMSEVLESTGIINEFGIMTADFIVGEYDEGTMKSSVVNVNFISNREKGKRGNDEGDVLNKVEKYRVCDGNLSEYIPCPDNVAAPASDNSKFSSSRNGDTENGRGLNCLVPRPKGYKHPIPWPESRDQVWFDNVPHTLEHNEGMNGVSKKDDKLIFQGDEPPSAHQYLDQMVPEIEFGRRTRVALDIIGSGIANFGAYMMEQNVTTLSVAPQDHESQIQLALERGLPAMVATFGTRRLPFPSQAFDLIHCSRCEMNWTLDDGVLLLEANRMLRAGGYFVWEARAVSSYEGKLGEQWREMDDLARNICWELVNYKEGYIAIWQKPLNNSCYLDRDSNIQPSLCETDDNPDDIWNVNTKKCITRLSEKGYGDYITNWPARLHSLPNRLFSIKADANESRKPIYSADSLYWKSIVQGYTSVFKINEMKIRNVMDMKAGYGGFAAALLDSKANSWIMNVVPANGPNTLPVIFDRGLVGVMHDWCEPFNTHPRTYDLLNAAGLFFVEQKRCNIRSIMMEMDRMLRPEGRVFIRDTTAVIYELQEIATTMGWSSFMFDTEEGPYSNWKLLICTKP